MGAGGKGRRWWEGEVFLMGKGAGAQGVWYTPTDSPTPMQAHALPLWLRGLFRSSVPTPLASPEADIPRTLLSLCLPPRHSGLFLCP